MTEITLEPKTVEWLERELPGRGPFTATRLSGGNSNETVLLADREGRMIMRRPPADAIDPSAHSMSREHRIMSALEGTNAPHPTPLGLCEDPEVPGAPFVLMEAIPGAALTESLPEGVDERVAAETIGYAMVEALAALHNVDWKAAGLEDYGRPDGFLDRQVPRWSKQFERVKVRELEDFHPVADWLAANQPPEQAPAIMHGDFHLDNTLIEFTPEARVRAIIDWEMSTIGDPLMDLGISLAFWGDDRPDAMAMPRVQAVSRLPGSPSRAQLAARYSEVSGRSVEHLNWYMAMGFWKLAAIVEGAYAQYTKGSLTTDYARRLEHDVPALLSEAAGFAGLK